MVTIVVELILYFIMAALFKRLTQISGLWASLGMAVGFTIITMLPYEWIILPICFGLLVFASAMRWGMYVAVGSAVILSLATSGLLYYGSQHPLDGGNLGMSSGPSVPGELQNLGF